MYHITLVLRVYQNIRPTLEGFPQPIYLPLMKGVSSSKKKCAKQQLRNFYDFFLKLLLL